MPRKLDDENRRAPRVNPARSGMRTGNPQLEPHEGGEVRSSPRERAPRRRGPVRVRTGEPRRG